MYNQIEQGVERLSAQAGGVPAETNARMAMSLYALATERGLSSVDHLVLNRQGTEHAAGSRVILVQGQDPSDPANRLAHMGIADAVGRPVEQSLQQAHAVEQQQARQAELARTQEPAVAMAAREAPTRVL